MGFMPDTLDEIRASIRRSAETLTALTHQAEAIGRIVDAVADAVRAGNKVLTCGHGGSAADALHMAEELVGRFDRERRSLPAVSLVADPTLLTCIANDYGYDHIFSRQIESQGQRGDVLVLFSTSGNSRSLALALEAAKRRQVTTVALLGKGGGAIAGQADHQLIVDSRETARIQEAHTLLLHLILEHIERHLDT